MNQKKNKEKKDQKATQPCLRLRAVTGRSDHKGDSTFCFSSKYTLSIRLIAEYYFSADGRRASYSVDDIRSSTSHVTFSDSLHKLASRNRKRYSKLTGTNLYHEKEKYCLSQLAQRCHSKQNKWIWKIFRNPTDLNQFHKHWFFKVLKPLKFRIEKSWKTKWDCLTRFVYAVQRSFGR